MWVSLLTGDLDRAGAGVPMAPRKNPPRPDAPPVWHNLNGTARVQKELRYMQQQIAAGALPQVTILPAINII